MDLTRAVAYRGASLNTFTPVAGRPGAVGCIVDEVDISQLQYTSFNERRRVDDGMTYIESYTALWPVTMRGTLYAPTRGLLFEALQDLREAFNPVKALMESPETKGFLPLTFSEPHDDYPLEARTLMARPLGLRWTMDSQKHGQTGLRVRDDRTALALQWTVQLLIDLGPNPPDEFPPGWPPGSETPGSGEPPPPVPVQASINRPVAFDYSQMCYFQSTGDQPYPGMRPFPTTGPLELLYDVNSPHAPTWIWYGIKCHGTGHVDVEFYTSTIGIKPISVTFAICVNGIPVATLIQYNADTGYGNDGRVTITNLPVVTDDIITATVVADPQGVPFFRAPRGTGDNGERLAITGGLLVPDEDWTP